MKKKLFIITSTKDQAEAVTDNLFRFDSFDIFHIKNSLPYMQRGSLNEDSEFTGGELLYLRNLEQLGALKSRNTLLLSNSIPILNHMAYSAYEKLLDNDFYFQASFEQTIPELSALYRALSLDGQGKMVLPLYGYIPLMISAGCTKKEQGLCDGKDEIIRIVDRKDISFPVANYCKACINVIFNSLPYCGYELLTANNLCPKAGLMAEFTIENYEETDEVLEYMEGILKGASFEKPPFNYTTGHLKRPVH